MINTTLTFIILNNITYLLLTMQITNPHTTNPVVIVILFDKILIYKIFLFTFQVCNLVCQAVQYILSRIRMAFLHGETRHELHVDPANHSNGLLYHTVQWLGTAMVILFFQPCSYIVIWLVIDDFVIHVSNLHLFVVVYNLVLERYFDFVEEVFIDRGHFLGLLELVDDVVDREVFLG